MQILLVEDDMSLADGLLLALKREGFAVNHVVTGKDALHVIKTEPPDILILDLGLPDMDGLTVLKHLREITVDVAVLLLTARDGTRDIVSGLDGGADDYLAKPFKLPELFARLRVLERRLGTAESHQINIASVCLDISTHHVSVDGKSVELPRREYMLLKTLMENAGKIQTRDLLDARLYSWGEEVSSNALEVHIHNLRKKLPANFIKTIRGVGYTVGKQ